MDKKTFVLLDNQRLVNAIEHLRSLPVDGSWEVCFSKITKDKTIKQLGALFGIWVKYLASTFGESEDYIHRMLKAKFLARIYITEPMNDMQDQWVELLAHYQETGQQDKLERHAKRISLSWSRLKQMKEYMSVIEAHYQAEGTPLPVIDKYHD